MEPDQIIKAVEKQPLEERVKTVLPIGRCQIDEHFYQRHDEDGHVQQVRFLTAQTFIMRDLSDQAGGESKQQDDAQVREIKEGRDEERTDAGDNQRIKKH